MSDSKPDTCYACRKNSGFYLSGAAYHCEECHAAQSDPWVSRPSYLASFDGEPWTDEREAKAWKRVEELHEEAIGMCYDDCHKIYLLMDHRAVEDMLSHGYAIIAPQMNILKEWYEEDSCSLRFINFIRGEVIEDVIPQLMWTEETK